LELKTFGLLLTSENWQVMQDEYSSSKAANSTFALICFGAKASHGYNSLMGNYELESKDALCEI